VDRKLGADRSPGALIQLSDRPRSFARKLRINRWDSSENFFAQALEIDLGFSNSIFAACGGAGRQVSGPAD
jgi:hypothetical protein